MSRCRVCNGEIRFERRGEKWWPLNPDGVVHWQTCRRIARGVKVLKPRCTPCALTHFWIGAETPWDESLGEYRDFTDIEKVERAVCAP